MKAIISLFICLSFFGKVNYHKQMDYKEYQGNFLPSLQEYFGDNDVRWNFCGAMTLLNTLDIMSQRELDETSGMTVVDLANQYFTKNGQVIFTYKNGDPAVNPNGSMNHTAIYWLADRIGKDKNLWTMKLIYGTNDSTFKEPVKKNDLQAIAKEMQNVFSQDGVIIMGVAVKGIDGKISYLHFITVLGIVMKRDGSAQMLIVDSMGKDHNGYYGWVNSEEYLTYNQDEYTGILNVYGVIPIKSTFYRRLH